MPEATEPIESVGGDVSAQPDDGLVFDEAENMAAASPGPTETTEPATAPTTTVPTTAMTTVPASVAPATPATTVPAPTTQPEISQEVLDDLDAALARLDALLGGIGGAMSEVESSFNEGEN